MASEETDLKQHSIANVIYRFLGGAALGVFMVLIPFLLSSVELNWLTVGVASLLVALCGVLASLFGTRFINALVRSLESSGLY